MKLRHGLVALVLLSALLAAPRASHAQIPGLGDGGFTLPSFDGGFTLPSFDGGFTLPSFDGGFNFFNDGGTSPSADAATNTPRDGGTASADGALVPQPSSDAATTGGSGNPTDDGSDSSGCTAATGARTTATGLLAFAAACLAGLAVRRRRR